MYEAARDDAIRRLVTLGDSLHMTAHDLLSNLERQYSGYACDARGLVIGAAILEEVWGSSADKLTIVKQLLNHIAASGDLFNE